MNKRQQKHEMLITFMANMKQPKRKRPALIDLQKLRSFLSMFVW